MHQRIPPLFGTLAYSLIGAAIGIGSVVLWLYLLAPAWPRWLVGTCAAVCALLLLTVAAYIHQPRPRRRAHARPATPKGTL